MDIIKLIIAITECQKELTQTLVDGGFDPVSDNKVRGEISGLERAKHIIQKEFEETTHAGDSEDDE